MKTSVFLLLLLGATTGIAQQPESSRIKELEQKLDQATRQLEQLNEAVQSLRAEIAKFKDARAVNQDVQSSMIMFMRDTISSTATRSRATTCARSTSAICVLSAR